VSGLPLLKSGWCKRTGCLNSGFGVCFILQMNVEVFRVLHAMTQRLDEVTALIPHNPEESLFLAQLSMLADDSALTIKNFRPGPPEENDRVQRIRVRLTGDGSYEGVCAFLDGLRSLSRLTNVSRLEISPLTVAGTYPFNMELSIFFTADSGNVVRRVAIND